MDVCVVTEPCYDCKYTDCVTVCPVDCFYEDERMLFIDPEECIGCSACIPECPVEAIYELSEVPSKWHQYVELNAERCAVLRETNEPLTQKLEPLHGAWCSPK